MSSPPSTSGAGKSGEAKSTPRNGKKDELLTRVRELLSERGQRLTYITVKRAILTEFTEKSFNKHKRRIQSMLEEYHERRTPARPKKRGATGRRDSLEAAAASKAKSSASSGAAGASDGDSKRQRRSKRGSSTNPRLYFYELNEEPETSAEGNRFIVDDDL